MMKTMMIDYANHDGNGVVMMLMLKKIIWMVVLTRIMMVDVRDVYINTVQTVLYVHNVSNDENSLFRILL